MQRGKTFQDTSIGNFVFMITPTQALFYQSTQHKRTLALQKGMQTIGTLQQSIPIIDKGTKKQHKHRFKPQQHTITFRVINDKNLNYQWTVYKVNYGELEEIDCMQFSIQSFWKSYIAEYEKNVTDLMQKIKDDKDSKKLLDTWKEIVNMSKERSDNLRVTSPSGEFRLDFRIEARSILDKQLEDYETEKVMRKVREAQKSNIRKSALTLTNSGQDDFTSDQIKIIQKIKRGNTELGEKQLGDKLNVNMLSPTNKNIPTLMKQRNETLKKFHSHQEPPIQKGKLRDDEVINKQFQSQLKLVSKSTGVKNSNVNIKGESVSQVRKRSDTLELSSKIRRQKTREEQTEQTTKQNTLGQQIKVIVMYFLMGMIMLWLLYNLMGHHSKVQYKK